MKKKLRKTVTFSLAALFIAGTMTVQGCAVRVAPAHTVVAKKHRCHKHGRAHRRCQPRHVVVVR